MPVCYRTRACYIRVMPTPNILLVTIDGLRASALGAYGNTTFPTPALDRFAARSLLLDFCFAPAADRDAILSAMWSDGTASLVATLRAVGYRATVITDDEETSASRIAGEFDDCVRVSAEPLHAHVRKAKDAAQTQLAGLFAAAAESLVAAESQAQQPQLVWVHSHGMYGAWDAPLELQYSLLDEEDPEPLVDCTPPNSRLAATDDPDIAFRYACAYNAQVMVLDECWDVLTATLDSNANFNNWLISLLGLRGFPLGEHQQIGGVDDRLYVEQLHVPWLLRFPDRLGQLCRAGQLTTHANLAATLLDRDVAGNIRALVTSAHPEWRDSLIASSVSGHRAIRTPDWCLRQDSATGTTPELFVRPDDRWEANDVAKLCSDEVESLTQMLDECLPQPGIADHGAAANR